MPECWRNNWSAASTPRAAECDDAKGINVKSQQSASSCSLQTVHQRFERRAEMHPHAPAVHSADGECWSYSRLNTLANSIASGLLGRGVKPEDRIGVCMQRSPETVAALLGILKAGAAYVPLDLSLPAARLRYITEDAKVDKIIVDRFGETRLREAHLDGVNILSPESFAGQPDHAPNLPASGSDLANLLYTSGSTGNPKGAMVEHRNILRLVIDTEWLKFSSDDVFLQISALSFDLSNFELWGPLLNGGSVVTVPQSPSLGEIEHLLTRFKVTTLWLTAGLFNVVMEERPEAIRNVKHLLTGGDIASPRHARIALKHLRGGELLNCYGPTENATFSTCHRVTQPDTLRSSIPIGRAVDNSPTLVLDDSLQVIRDFRVGEIYVGGEGLSRGYWNRQELTSQKFLQVEIAPGQFERFYRTGDLGRYNEAGLLEFVGRTDFQVKIRGFRVEPEEIEVALSAVPGLTSAAVIAIGSGSESKQLCCCYVANGSGAVEVETIQSFLRAKFPDYMVPTRYRELPSLPRNSNDKVDRKKLAQLFAAPITHPVQPEHVTTTTEQTTNVARSVGGRSVRNRLRHGIKTITSLIRQTSGDKRATGAM